MRLCLVFVTVSLCVLSTCRPRSDEAYSVKDDYMPARLSEDTCRELKKEPQMAKMVDELKSAAPPKEPGGPTTFVLRDPLETILALATKEEKLAIFQETLQARWTRLAWEGQKPKNVAFDLIREAAHTGNQATLRLYDLVLRVYADCIGDIRRP